MLGMQKDDNLATRSIYFDGALYPWESYGRTASYLFPKTEVEIGVLLLPDEGYAKYQVHVVVRCCKHLVDTRQQVAFVIATE